MFFLEWLFVVTKPSFLSNVSWLIKFEILFFVTACIICFSLMLVFCFYLLEILLQSKNIKKITFTIASFVPSIIFASLILLLFDNFTYTMFQFGIVSSYGILRTIYALGYFIFFVLFTWKIYSWSKSIGSAFIIRAPNVRLFIVSIVLIVLSLVVPLNSPNK